MNCLKSTNHVPDVWDQEDEYQREAAIPKKIIWYIDFIYFLSSRWLVSRYRLYVFDRKETLPEGKQSHG